MRFARTEDQTTYAQVVVGLTRRMGRPEDVRAAGAANAGPQTPLWKALDEIGFLSLLAPEEFGGGGSELEMVAAIEVLGEAAAPGPLVEHAAVAVPLLAQVAPERLERAISSGEVLTVATESTVPYATGATVLVLDKDRVGVLDLGEAEARPALDDTRHVSRLSDTDSVTLIAEGPEVARAVCSARDRGAVATAAMLVGLATRAVTMTVEHAKVRTQFGKPIGSFQAVKHHLANAHVAIEYARPLVDAAAWALATGDESLPLAAMAKVMANKAGRKAAKASLQCHGAIGYTTEADLHLYLMRIWSLLNSWGGTDGHRHQVSMHLAL